MNDLHSLILSILIFFPIAGALLVAVMPRRLTRETAVAVALLNFIFSLHLPFNWAGVTASTAGFRFEQSLAWLPQFGVTYHLGVDGLSVFLVLLTTFLTPLILLAAWNVTHRTKEFLICLLLIEACVVGVFCALDVILFYIFWEAVLVPIFVLMLGWGGARRTAAAMKLFLYTMLGSVLMWVAMLYVYLNQTPGLRSFDYEPFAAAAKTLDGNGPTGPAFWLFLAFAVAFAIKTPLFPFHSWQADAYTEAPTAGTVMLAAIMTKMGTYGFVRFAIPLFPNAATNLSTEIMILAIIGIIYGALIAVRQTDFKRLIAYSSLSHLGFVVLGSFAALQAGQTGITAFSGAALQMVSHGLTTAALFLLLGFISERRQSNEIAAFGGLAAPMPRYTVLFWIALFASIGLPGLSGFVGEYLILQGTMAVNFWYAAAAASGVIWGAVYMLRMFRSLMYGEITQEENRGLSDVNAREWSVLAVILAAVIWIGIAPQPLLSVINTKAATLNLPGAATTPLAPQDSLARADETVN